MRTRAFGGMLVSLLLVTGCTSPPQGPKPLSKQEYFARLEQSMKEYRDSEAEDPGMPGIKGMDEEWLNSMKDTLVIALAESKTELQEVESLTPPADLNAQHDDLVKSLKSSTASLQRLLDAWDKAESDGNEAEIGAAIEAFYNEFSSELMVEMSFEHACRLLQLSAMADEVDVNLDCPMGGLDQAVVRSSLRDALAAAKSIHEEEGTYAGLTVEAMAAKYLPLAFVDSETPSTGHIEVSVYTDGDGIFAAASYESAYGECYMLRDDFATGTTTYALQEIVLGGSAEEQAECTGEKAATLATGDYWEWDG